MLLCANYIGQTGRSFSSFFYEHLKALTTNYIHSIFATHLHNENLRYTNIEHNMEILHYLPKSRKLYTAEQFEIYRYHALQPNNILNEQLHYKSHTLFDTLIHTHTQFEPQRLSPVSYTHLDVYKRQIRNSSQYFLEG